MTLWGHFITTGLDSRAGKVTLFTILGGASTFLVVFMFASLEIRVPMVNASDVTTSVHILNTPPVWTVDAQESTESSTAVPTNAGSTITWVATGTDSNNDNYYLLICKTNGAPTAHSGAAPTCGGGDSNQWAVSASTASAAQASAATTTTEAFAESNAWYAWICDNNASLAQCNATPKQGSSNTASPFIVNHPPVFASVSNNSPRNPGQTVTWTTTAYDNDTLTTNTVKLFLCKAADFAAGACGAGGTWATSTLQSTNPSTSTAIAIPTQDKVYNAYAYLVDAFGLAATSTVQATNSSFTVSNVAPTITAATISLVDTDNSGNLTLLTPFATSGPFKVQFQVDDNNSCLNSSSGNEITHIITDVYRSGVTQASCQTSGNYDANSCYPSASPLTDFSCTQDGGSCSGASDTSSTWTCTYSLWYNADPTDVSTQYTAQNWLASVQAGDDNFATSTLTESSTGNELVSFLAFTVPESGVGFGSLQPGQQNDPLATTTALKALGNVGLDETIYGDTMCTTWSSADSCDSDGINAANDIPIANQKVATSSVAYASSLAYTLSGSTTPISVGIHVQKTTSTSTPQQKNTWWGINIPSSLTLAGDYRGQDTIIAQKSAAANW
jgi:hypothetical protein